MVEVAKNLMTRKRLFKMQNANCKETSKRRNYRPSKHLKRLKQRERRRAKQKKTKARLKKML